MSRPFCSHVAMLQDGASSGVFFVNKLVLLLVDLKIYIIKWKLHFRNFALKSNGLVITDRIPPSWSSSRG